MRVIIFIALIIALAKCQYEPTVMPYDCPWDESVHDLASCYDCINAIPGEWWEEVYLDGATVEYQKDCLACFQTWANCPTCV